MKLPQKGQQPPPSRGEEGGKKKQKYKPKQLKNRTKKHTNF